MILNSVEGISSKRSYFCYYLNLCSRYCSIMMTNPEISHVIKWVCILFLLLFVFFVNWHDYVTFSEIWIITCKFNSPVCSVYQKHGTQHKSTNIIFQILSLFRWTKSKPAQYKECNLIRKHSLQLFFFFSDKNNMLETQS